MSKKPFGKFVLISALTVAGYGLIVRPWLLSWGLQKDELHLTLPGDELVQK